MSVKPGELVTCVLCGGDGSVSEETARDYGGYGCTCPSCEGKGKVPFRPLPPGPHWGLCYTDGEEHWLTYDAEGRCVTGHRNHDSRGARRVVVHAGGKEYTAYGADLYEAFKAAEALVPKKLVKGKK